MTSEEGAPRFLLSSPGARSANRGSSGTCEAPVWIPARRCAIRGATPFDCVGLLPDVRAGTLAGMNAVTRQVAAPPMPDADALVRLVARMRREIPLTVAMGVEAGTLAGNTLQLRAPLAPNANDKGCAFGGSLASLMTLAAWALIELHLDARGSRCEVYVQDSGIDYLAPVWGELRVTARLAEGEDWAAFFAALDTRGKGRLTVLAQADHAGMPATRMRARFVAKRVLAEAT